MRRALGVVVASLGLTVLATLGACTDNTRQFGDASVGGDGDAAVDAPSSDAPLADACNVPAEPPLPEPARYTPRWAFAPWISKDISDTADTYAFVDGFKSRDIPVGVVVIDSPWENAYNTFVPNDKRYPAFKKLVADMHARGVRVVLWITQMVNTINFDYEPTGDKYDGPAPNFEDGRRCGFYVMNGKTYPWWKGRGAGVDFFNARARTWWHRQQDQLLEWGVDGWKLDFGDSYIELDPIITANGLTAHQKYSEAYYRDFLAYGQHKSALGREFVTMVRGYDKSYQFAGRFFAKPEHAPVVWMGDNRRDFEGLVDALDQMFRSANAGYQVLGSDIGGYLDIDDKDVTQSIPFDQNNFVRWVAVGALNPFMQLHGRGNLTPWTVTPKTNETVAIYRYWAWVHHDLLPFYYSLAQAAYAGGANLLRPIGDEKSWPGDYRYQLGDALLVAPLLDDSGKRDVALPAGAKWYDWWRPAGAPLDGGTTLAAYDASDQQHIPLFVREGAIIPARVERDVSGFGSAASKGYLTLLVYAGPTKSSFVLYDSDDKTTDISAQRSGGVTTISISRLLAPLIVRARADVAPTSVAHDGSALAAHATFAAFEGASSGTYYDSTLAQLWIKIDKASGSHTLTVR